MLWGIVTIYTHNKIKYHEINFANPLTSLIINNILLYGSIGLWSWSQIGKSRLNFPRIFGKIPKVGAIFSYVLILIPLLIFSWGTILLTFYIFSLFLPEFIRVLMRQDLFVPFTIKNNDYIIYNILQFFSNIFLSPIIEEIFFRGLLLQRWAIKWGLVRGIIISSLLFGLLHFNPVSIFVLGLINSIIYLKTNTLLLPIIIHSLNNLAIVILELLSIVIDHQDTINSLAQLQSSWLWSIFYIAISTPFLVFFLYRGWPTKKQKIPYLTNKFISRSPKELEKF
jgi:membrane protease YdiL (CAAX protease family)